VENSGKKVKNGGEKKYIITARHMDESSCSSICFCGEEFLRWRRTLTGVDSGEAFTATVTELRR
jgi:hypothetical protein